MENASKALIMAAGVLMGILILSLGVYLAHIVSGYAEITHNQIAQNSIKQFNDKFLQYDGLECTIQDVITVKNYAIENNEQDEAYTHINVYLKKIGEAKQPIQTIKDEELLTNEIIELESNKDPKRFKCTVNINSDTERVEEVLFEEK